jgi:RsiW-degrading membrane proteinase PrsW (M82 family)
MTTSDPKIIGLALLGGIIPALLWLWFWLKEEGKKDEPRGVLAVMFFLGMIGVVCVLPIQKFIQAHIASHNWQIGLWAMSEEIIKYLAVILIVYHTDYIEDPIDWPIFLITAALGFAALENALFLLKPLSLGQDTVGLLTGQLRFLGSTLLHTVTSGILGISLGISMQMGWFKKKLYPLIGLIFAISLHTVFNFFIIRNSGSDFLKVFGFLWVVTIILMLLFEKVRRMSPSAYVEVKNINN